MKKSELYAALRRAIHRHDYSTYVDDPPSVVEGGRGVVVPGCPTCRMHFGTMPQFLDHLTDDVLPAVLDRLSSGSILAGSEDCGRSRQPSSASERRNKNGD